MTDIETIAKLNITPREQISYGDIQNLLQTAREAIALKEINNKFYDALRLIADVRLEIPLDEAVSLLQGIAKDVVD